MNEQTVAYDRLEEITQDLSNALIKGEPVKVETLTRDGESDLLNMRTRLAEIASTLTKFAELRTTQPDTTPLDIKIREQFEKSAKDLLEIARNFQALASKATNLALGGSSFATACIQTCGLPPTTYNAPILKYAQGGRK